MYLRRIRRLVAVTLVAVSPSACAGGACEQTARPGGGHTDLRAGLPAIPAGATWQWQITDAVETGLDVSVYDVDLFDVPADDIAALTAAGHVVICYFSAGSYEDWRPDKGDFPDGSWGNPLGDWPGEYWLDTRNDGVRAVMTARMDLAVQKGCDGVEPDNVDGFDNDPGFPLTRDDQLEFNRFLATEAHARGLSVGLKNASGLVADLVDDFDWSLVEECVAFGECADYRPFLDAGKAVLHTEYVDKACDDPEAVGRVCGDASREGFSTLVKQWDLGAWGHACAG